MECNKEVFIWLIEQVLRHTDTGVKQLILNKDEQTVRIIYKDKGFTMSIGDTNTDILTDIIKAVTEERK